VISSDEVGEWHWYFWVLLGCCGVAILILLIYIFYLYYLSGWYILVAYALWAIFLIASITTMSLIFGNGTHFHHYFVALLIMSFCGHHNFVTSCLHGLMNGIYIEGCARWSMDSVWEIKRDNLSGWLKDWLLPKENV